MNEFLNNIDYTKDGYPIVSFVYNSFGIVIATLKTPFIKNTYYYNIFTVSKGIKWLPIKISFKKYFPKCKDVFYL